LPNIEEIKILEISERFAAKQYKDGNHPPTSPTLLLLLSRFELLGKGVEREFFIPFQCIFFAVIV